MTRNDVFRRLTSRFHEGLLRRSYDSLRNRISPDGYFPESLTGAYAGMFPRVSGPLALLLMETGESEVAESVLHYCIQGMLDNEMERIPHVIGQRDESGRIPLLCDEDQIDGQAHVILAWATLAGGRTRTPYEDLSYAIVAGLLDRSLQAPYFLPNPTGGRALPGLVRNWNLEHSRDDHFWDAYDLLTQSFVASAIERMIPIAQRRRDEHHARCWKDALGKLEANIARNMTRTFEGHRIYFEMLLPADTVPYPFPGLSWVNLAPIAAGCQSVDASTLERTIDTWRRVARIPWDGGVATSCEWLPEGHADRHGRRQCNVVIGKALGWDMLHAFRCGQHEYLTGCLDFLEQVNQHDLFAEAFFYDAGQHEWRLNDPGNGEQTAWWVWSMGSIRKEIGLPRIPRPHAADVGSVARSQRVSGADT